MKVVIAGGTGFLGRALSAALTARGCDVVVLSRGSEGTRGPRLTIARWDPAGDAGDLPRLFEGADGVVNLAGESIGDRRWTGAQKALIRSSRIAATRRIVDAIARMPAAPALISISAIGYYGDRGTETLTESSAPGDDFLARVCIEWEAEAMKASPRARVALVRGGLVLGTDGGALPRMLLPFRFFVGGPLGSGRQYMSWIHRDDWVGLVEWLMTKADAHGPFNATTPNPVTNREFANALGAALHRPSFMPAPAFALKIALGEMAGPLLLGSQRVIPARATEAGFTFKYATLPDALRAIVQKL